MLVYIPLGLGALYWPRWSAYSCLEVPIETYDIGILDLRIISEIGLNGLAAYVSCFLVCTSLYMYT